MIAVIHRVKAGHLLPSVDLQCIKTAVLEEDHQKMRFLKLLWVFSIFDTVYVVVPGSAGTDKVVTVDHSVAQSFPIIVTGGVVLRVTIAGNVKRKNIAADTAG